jgi:nitrilase
MVMKQILTVHQLHMLTLLDRTIWANSVIDCAGFMDEYFMNSLEKESPQMDRIRAAVAKAGIFVVLGYSERFKNSCYIAQVSIPLTSLVRPTVGEHV